MVPYGPKEIGKNRQIALPAELLTKVRLAVGDLVYVALADDPPGALIVLPVELVLTWLERGRGDGSDTESADAQASDGSSIGS